MRKTFPISLLWAKRFFHTKKKGFSTTTFMEKKYGQKELKGMAKYIPMIPCF
jgi:hypothetical protein